MTGYSNLQGNPAAALPAYICTGGGGSPLGYQQLTAGDLETAQSLTIPTGAVLALLVAEVEAVRWRDDGTAPTASIGMLLPVNQLPFIYTAKLSAIQFIAAASGAVLNVAYY